MSAFLLASGVTLPNASSCPKLFSFLRPTLPDEVGLTGLYFLGGNATLSARNLVSGGVALTPVGAPTINALGATLNQSNCFNTGLTETAAWTFIAIAQPIAAGIASGNGAMLVSNFLNSGAIGTSLYMPASATINAAEAVTISTSAVATLAVSPLVQTDWYQFCARGDAASEDVTYQHAGAMATPASPGAAPSARALTGRTINIGGHYDTAFQASVNIVAVAVWNKKLSDANRLATFAVLASFFSANAGITSL